MESWRNIFPEQFVNDLIHFLEYLPTFCHGTLLFVLELAIGVLYYEVASKNHWSLRKIARENRNETEAKYLRQLLDDLKAENIENNLK